MLQVGEISERIEVNASRPMQTAAQQSSPQRIRVGGLVHAARLLHRVRPEYPRSLEEAGVAGTVQLSAAIRPDGSVGGIRVIHSPHADLSAAARRAVEQWRYQPATLNGKPVSIVINISINFELGQ
jgi:protein TonB